MQRYSEANTTIQMPSSTHRQLTLDVSISLHLLSILLNTCALNTENKCLEEWTEIKEGCIQGPHFYHLYLLFDPAQRASLCQVESIHNNTATDSSISLPVSSIGIHEPSQPEETLLFGNANMSLHSVDWCLKQSICHICEHACARVTVLKLHVQNKHMTPI